MERDTQREWTYLNIARKTKENRVKKGLLGVNS